VDLSAKRLDPRNMFVSWPLYILFIIELFIIPIGKLSKEAQEARNKDFKYFREFNTRKHNICNK